MSLKIRKVTVVVLVISVLIQFKTGWLEWDTELENKTWIRR